jgi:hypothetical protein
MNLIRLRQYFPNAGRWLGSWLVCTTFIITENMAEEFRAITEEAEVPAYTLPDLLEPHAPVGGEAFQQYWAGRRQSLLESFTTHVYGSYPSRPFQLVTEKQEAGPTLKGRALRQQFRVMLKTEHGSLPIDLVVFSPASAERPVPCFLSLNFTGNHTVAADPEIPVTQNWMRNDKAKGIDDHRAKPEHRGQAASRWPIAMAIEAGCAVATAYYGDIDPDFDDGFQNGVHALFPEHRASAEHPERWGSIAAWAWGLSRLYDCLATSVPQVDSRRVAVLGHSRLGKAALWAGATDQRFAAVISNDSGCGGAALSKRIFGETVGRINDSFPHWFCPNFRQYSLHESRLPIDQHQLLALMAPRPLYVASASEDLWADPRGEFLAIHGAQPVYQRLGFPALGFHDLPEPGAATIGRVSYHLRAGKHDIDAWDWEHYLQMVAAELPASP